MSSFGRRAGRWALGAPKRAHTVLDLRIGSKRDVQDMKEVEDVCMLVVSVEALRPECL
jgi:hypothetical protein